MHAPIPSARFAGLLFAGLAALASAGCTGDMRTYDDVMRGRTRCADGGCRSDWHTYGDVMKGCMRCGSGTTTNWSEYGEVMRGDFSCSGRSCEPCAPCPPKPCDPCGRPVSAVMPEGMPAEAKPGEAWCRVRIPAVYETVTERVCVECARCTEVWVPPVTEVRTRSVCVAPATTTEVTVPGVTRTVEYCEVVCPARTEVRPVDCPPQGCDPCAPRPACYARVTVPPETATRTREVCVQPPSTRCVTEPAQYSTDLEVCEVKPGYWKTVEFPAVYDTVTHQVLKTAERWEWRRNAACTVPAPAPAAPCVPSGPAAR